MVAWTPHVTLAELRWLIGSLGISPNKHSPSHSLPVLPPPPAFRFSCCCEVIDDRSVTSSLTKFPNLPQGNCSFLHKSISISPTQQPAKFIHYAATQTHDCDELHPTLNMAEEKKKPYVLICRTSLFVFFRPSQMPCQGWCGCKVI